MQAIAGLVDHHRHDDAWRADRGHAHEPRAVLVGGVALAFLLVRGAALAAHRVADGLRLLACAAGRGCHLQHLADLDHRGRREDSHAGDGLLLAHQRHRDHIAVARQRCVGARHLQQRSRQAVAVGHRGLLHRAPLLVRFEPAGDDARKVQLRFLPVAHGAEELPQLAGRHLHGHARGAHVAGFLDHLLHGEGRMRVRVPHHQGTDDQAARSGVDHGVDLDTARLQGLRGDQRLHRRTGFEDVGHGAVAQLRATEVGALRRVVAGEVGQRQHLAGVRVQHHHAAGHCLVFTHRVAHPLVGEELHLGVQRQGDIVAVHRVGLVTHAFHDPAQAVAQHLALAHLAQQLRLETAFDAVDALAVDVREAHHVGGRLTFGVTPLELAHVLHTLDAQRLDLLPLCLFDLAPQQQAARAQCVDAFVQVPGRQAHQPGQGLALSGVGGEVLAIDLHRGQGHAAGQHEAVAIEDAAPAGGQGLLVHEALLALGLVEVGVQDLQPDGAAQQHRKCQPDQRHDKARTPWGRLAGQQGTGGVVDAAHAAGAGAADAAAHRATPDATASGT